jgi:hypothetical protein
MIWLAGVVVGLFAVAGALLAAQRRAPRSTDECLARLALERERTQIILKHSEQLLFRVRWKLSAAQQSRDEAGVAQWTRKAAEIESVIADCRKILSESPLA